MRIYLSGPYGDHNTKRVRLQNVNKARDMARELIKLNHCPFVPHFNHYIAEGWADKPDESVWLAMGISWLLACDAVLMLEGWEQSEGARLEREVAQRFGVPVYETIAALQGEEP